MKDTRLQQALAALDDARTTLKDILDEGGIIGPDHTFLILACDDTNRAIDKVKAVAA